jgi:hypothetical protein
MLELNVLDTNSLSSFVFSIFIFTCRIWRIFKIERKKNTKGINILDIFTRKIWKKNDNAF